MAEATTKRPAGPVRTLTPFFVASDDVTWASEGVELEARMRVIGRKHYMGTLSTNGTTLIVRNTGEAIGIITVKASNWEIALNRHKGDLAVEISPGDLVIISRLDGHRFARQDGSILLQANFTGTIQAIQ
jgi:uncharacterized protein YigA (DUF484 family)